MAVEAGVAYISIAASTKDFAKDVKSALGDFEQESRQVTSGKGGFGPMLASGLKKATVAGAGFAAVVSGIAIKGGLDRALGLEQAEAKLTGLGHSAESVDKIMDNALESVKGTAFGLQDAASVAASAVAAGIKPGADLERTLKAVADASTIAGTDMNSMGAIFNKVAASNKVQMDVINQLHDAGVPALALLADQMGVTAEEASKMASAGEIDFETFRAAMESGMGGAALESGKTTQGAWNNMMAALGRVGEKLVSKVLPHATKFFGKVIEWADKAGPHVEKFAEALGEKIPPAIDWLKNNLLPVLKVIADVIGNTVVPAVISFGKWLGNNQGVVKAAAVGLGALVVVMQAHAAAMAVQAAGGIMGFIKGLKLVQGVTKIGTAIQWAWNAALSANPIGIIVVAIAALVAGLVYFFTQTEMGQEVWQKFTDFLSTAWEWIKDAFQVGVEFVTEWLGKAWDFIKQVWSYSPLGLIVENWDKIVGAFSSAVETVKGWMQNVWDFIKKVWEWTPLGLIVNNWDKIVGAFKGGIEKVKGWLQNVWDFIKKVWSYTPLGMITSNWDKILDFFKKLPSRIGKFFDGVTNFITKPFKMAFNAVAGFWNNSVGKLSFSAPDWVPGIGGKGWSLPKLPMLAKGGTATSAGWSIVGEEGPELLRMPRAASVIPLDHPAANTGTDGGGISIQVREMNVREEGDIRKVAQELQRLLQRDSRAVAY